MSTTPRSGTESRSAAAQKAEALSTDPAAADAGRELITVEFNGETFTIDPSVATDLEVFEAVQDENWLFATRGILGAEQWKRFKASLPPHTAERPTVGFMYELMSVISDKLKGVTVPE